MKNMSHLDKYADDVSKSYYQDALKDLDDQYSKSYYTGLKSMYDQKLGNVPADFQKLYNSQKETGADLIVQSHPLSIDIADAKGKGGVVENQLEQQRHNIGVAFSMPTGNFTGKYASLIESLVKIANEADKNGLLEDSNLIDHTIAEIVSVLKTE